MSHETWVDQAAGYALDALSTEERSAFEGHLRECAECQREVRALREAASRLAEAAPPAVPRAAVRERILAEARRVRPIGRGRLPAPAAVWLAAAAAVVLALVGGYGYWSERGTRLTLHRVVDSTRAELARRDSTLAALLGPEVEVVSLASTGRQPTARVFWNRRHQVFVVTAFDLPAAPSGRTYQLWAIAEGRAPLSMGTFNTDALGRATLVLPVAPGIAGLAAVELCGITEEPAGGSPQPTEQPRLLGSWRQTD